MKFIKITTKHKNSQLKSILSNLSINELEYIEKIYNKFNHVEFTNELLNECLFASIHEEHITDLLSIHVNLSIDFIYEDLTKDALYNNIPTDNKDILNLLDSFIDENIDVDIVLDKILDLGKESLTDKDILVLNQF